MDDVTVVNTASVGRRVLALIVAAVLAVGVGSCSSDGTVSRSSTDARDVAASTSPSAARDVQPAQPARPVVSHRTVQQRGMIRVPARTIATAALEKGVTRLRQAGRPGVRVKVWRLTLKDGRRVERRLVRTFVARRPVARITLRGTRVDPPPAPVVSSSCDSNYSGACVPISSDVDCGGGSGNGPEYVYGTVRVVGTDIYDLDADGDGYGCD